MDNTYLGLCYTSREALFGTRNSPMGQPWGLDPTNHRTMSWRSINGATSRILKGGGGVLHFLPFLFIEMQSLTKIVQYVNIGYNITKRYICSMCNTIVKCFLAILLSDLQSLFQTVVNFNCTKILHPRTVLSGWRQYISKITSSFWSIK